MPDPDPDLRRYLLKDRRLARICQMILLVRGRVMRRDPGKLDSLEVGDAVDQRQRIGRCGAVPMHAGVDLEVDSRRSAHLTGGSIDSAK